jgi:hypothetical protein
MKFQIVVANALLTMALAPMSSAAQGVSDDGSYYTTNAAGLVSYQFSPELAAVDMVKFYREKGLLTNALQVCNAVLATNATHRWARFYRMELYADIGDLAAADGDFSELTNRFPNFTQPYFVRALRLLAQPVDENSRHPLLEWLNSEDKHKKEATMQVVNGTMESIQANEKKWLASADESKQRKAIQVLQLGFKATNEPDKPVTPKKP